MSAPVTWADFAADGALLLVAAEPQRPGVVLVTALIIDPDVMPGAAGTSRLLADLRADGWETAP
jgi:hypothetical protein